VIAPTLDPLTTASLGRPASLVTPRSRLAYSALVAVSLFGSTLAASAQTGGEGAGAAAIPGREVRAGGRSNIRCNHGIGCYNSNAMRLESQYTIGDKQAAARR
jgi:hypothetical protein